jgi:PKD repeat protein
MRKHGSTLRRGGLLLVALIAGMVLGLRGPTPWRPSVASACGFISPQTMDANGAPALANPVIGNVPKDQPVGIFALDFAARQPITFAEDLSRVPGAPPRETLKWRWNFSDGSGWISGVTPAHTFKASGTFNVYSQIFDTSSNTWTDFDSAQIHVIAAQPTNPPTAKATSSATSIEIGADVTFDATGSQSADGSALTYLWNFNDGETVTQAKVTHKFATGGSSFVALIVTDKRGAKAVATIDVVIVPELPKAALSVSATTASVGATVSFDASQSSAPSNPPGDTLIRYQWDFGDGSQATTTNTPTTTHVFTATGTYTVKVGAIEQSGAMSVASQTVTIVAGSVGGANGANGGVNWLLLAIGIVALLGGGALAYMGWQGQRERMALVRQRQRAQELARAKRVNPPTRTPRAQPPGQA